MANVRRPALALLAFGVLLLPVFPAAAQQGWRAVEERAADFAPEADAPASFALRGVVVDTAGAPLPGAALRIGGRTVEADARGRFDAGTVAAGASVAASHPDAVPAAWPAWRLWSGEGGTASVVLPRYTESFAAGPAGGVFRGRTMTLEVPEGALDRPVTIRAAALPPDLAYDDGPGIQPRRLAAVALAPEGLRFARPVRLRLPNALAAEAPPGDVLLRWDARSGRYLPAADAAVERDGGFSIMTLGHFSRYASGTPAEGVERRLTKITTDLNGDGKTTTQDAEFVVILSGGDHGAEWVKSTGSSAAVMRTAGRSASSSGTQTVGGTAGVSFGGVGVEVGREVSKTEAEEVTSSVGSGTSGSASQAVEFRLATPEFDTDCAYLLRWYEYWRVRKWVRHTPGDKEAPGLRDAHDGRADQSSEWGYFDIQGSQSIAVGRTLYGGDKVAVRKTAAGYEFYRLAGEYLARVPKGLHALDCKAGKPNERAAKGGREAARFFGGGAGMADAAFDGSSTVRYLGWGVLPDSLPERYTNMECRRETSGEVTVTAETEEASEDTVSRTAGKSTTVSAEAKLEIPVVGVELGGGASASSTKETTRGQSASYASKLTSQVSTTVRWQINDPHKPLLVHWSDHELHRLHLLLETRSWRLVPESQIPEAVRDAAGTGEGRSFVGTAGGGMVMRDADGAFLVSGPPLVTQKEIGFMLVRIDQRPCPGTPTTTPDESGGGDDAGGDESGGNAPSGATTPAGKGKVYTPRGNMENYTTVAFTALDGETVIDRRAIGEVQSVTFVAVDGRRLAEQEKQARVTADAGTVRLDAGDAAGVASIIVGGSAGSVELFRPRRAPASPRAAPDIQDGSLDVRNGAVRDTVRLPGATAQPPQGYRVTVNDRPVQAVAVRQGEVAIAGRDVPMPTEGRSNVAVTDPAGRTTSASVPSWGFTVHVQPVTYVGETVPVLFDIEGVEPERTVQVTLLPAPGQQVTPLQVTLSGDQLSGGPRRIARLTANTPGPQVLNVRVMRLGENPDH
jgi:hypothetical protein